MTNQTDDQSDRRLTKQTTNQTDDQPNRRPTKQTTNQIDDQPNRRLTRQTDRQKNRQVNKKSTPQKRGGGARRKKTPGKGIQEETPLRNGQKRAMHGGV